MTTINSYSLLTTVNNDSLLTTVNNDSLLTTVNNDSLLNLTIARQISVSSTVEVGMRNTAFPAIACSSYTNRNYTRENTQVGAKTLA